MGLLSDLRQLQATTKQVQAEAQKGYHGGSYGYGYGMGGYGYNWQSSGGITDLFHQMYGNEAAGLTNPRTRLNDYRLIFEKLAPFALATKRKRELVGNPVIESKDKGFADEMNARLAEIKSTGELRNAYGTDKGISNLMGELIINMLVDGSSFLTFEDKDGNELQKASSKFDCVRIHDAERFSYMETGIQDTYDLQYIKQGIQVVINQYRDTFRVLQFDRSKFLWGLPLSYHTPFILKAWLIAIGAREQSNSRIGAPLELTLFGAPMPTGQIDPAASVMAMQQSAATATNLATAYKTGIANRNTKLNQPVDIVGTVSADIKVSKHRYGDGVKSPSDFIPESEHYGKLMATSWEYPLVLLGLANSSGGIGSEEFAHAAAAAELSARKQQNYLGRNVVVPILDRWQLEERRNAPKYEITWDGQTIEDQSRIAETKAKEATTNLTNLQSLELARMLLSPEEQQIWAQALGIEYITF